jgi:hypothetical protein
VEAAASREGEVMSVTYEERAAKLEELLLQLRKEEGCEDPGQSLYSLWDAHESSDHPKLAVKEFSVTIRVSARAPGYSWDYAGQQMSGFHLSSDRSPFGVRRLDRTVEFGPKAAKSIHKSVLKYLTTLREKAEWAKRRRQRINDEHVLNKERVKSFAAGLKASGFDAGAFLDDPHPWVLVTFDKNVTVMLEPAGAASGLGFRGKARPLAVPETFPEYEKYMQLLRDFLLGVAALETKA